MDDSIHICPTTGKIRYASGKLAHNATVGVRRRRKESARAKKESPYRCRHCAGWHLGRRWLGTESH